MSQELLLTDWTQNSGTGTFDKSSGELVLSGGLAWIYTDYIELPTGTGITYKYDFDISVTANNQVFIQIERFDADKNSISNNAAVNIVKGYKPTSNASHQRYVGNIDIATFNNGTTTAYIRCRICNGYNSTTGTHIVHNWSLRAMLGTTQTPLIDKNGLMLADYFKEKYGQAGFVKTGFAEGGNFYEY